MKSRNRLYFKGRLTSGECVEIVDQDQVHYLSKVMRCRVGEIFTLFNELDGNYYAKVSAVSKKTVALRVSAKSEGEGRTLYPLTLCYAPIKNASNTFIVQKAVELGVSEIVPFYSERSVIKDFKSEKLEKVAIEAVEQSGWISILKMHSISKFDEMLLQLSTFDVVIFCDEKEGARKIAASHLQKIAVIVGPEGGFSDKERDALLALPNVQPVTLGRAILRAETAIISALSVVTYSFI